jgi:hypothetical protein
VGIVSVQAPLRNLAGELGVELGELTEDQFNEVAIRFVLRDDLRAEVLQEIVEDVRGGGRRAGPTAEAALARPTPPPPHQSGYRFNATEADRIQRLKLADRHRAEDGRTGLWLVPRRPDPLPLTKYHPSCIAAVGDGLQPCRRCSGLRGDDPYTEAHLDDDD